MSSSQINELREAARQFEGYQNGEISRMLREAADTIESLRDRLQGLQGVGGESRYSELFGTPVMAAETLIDMCHSMADCSHCPMYAAGVAFCDSGGYEGDVLEWLRGDAE